VRAIPATPAVLLRARLAALRAEGVPFADAWFSACAGGFATYRDPQVWIEVFADEAVRDTFRRCYDREPPTPLDRAMAVLGVDVLEIGADRWERICELEGCERPLKGRSPLKRFCCGEHRRLATYARERERRSIAA
jgi:hypothetical protein